jgi:hypothetical protein
VTAGDISKVFTPLTPMSLSDFFRRYSEFADYSEDTILVYEVMKD